VYRLSIPPGADRISALVYAGYLGDFTATPIELSDGTIYTVTNYSWSYVGVDASSAEIRRLYRGYCYGAENEGTADEVWYCCNPRELSEAPPCGGPTLDMFVPTSATTLFGVP
jgi:hypothetical protein